MNSYEDLALFCFGKKVIYTLQSASSTMLSLGLQAAIFVELNILVFCFGISIAYLVTLGDILTPMGELYFGNDSILSKRWALMSFSCGVIMLPLSLLRDISSLQFSSILGVFSIIFLVIAVCIRSVMYSISNGVAKSIYWGFNYSNGLQFMLSVPIVMFAFTNQVALYLK